MTPDQMRAAAELTAGRAQLEASGGVTPDRLQELGGTGIQWVSLGYLTHSAPALDLSMTIELLE